MNTKVSYQNQYINFLKGLAAIMIFTFHFTLTYFSGHKNVSLPIFLFTPPWTATWIFFILSGFTIGCGFWKNKYSTESLNGFLNFYTKRFIRIFPLYFLIVFIDLFFVNTDIYFNNHETLFRTFLFRLRNPFATSMTGNLWFVTTILHLYILTPIVFKFLLKPLQKLKQKSIINAFLIISIILIYAVLRHFWFVTQKSWSNYIYVNWFCNLDLYFGAFIFSYFCLDKSDVKIKKILRPCSILILFIFLAINIVSMALLSESSILSYLTKITYPSIILTIVLISLYAFNTQNSCYNLGSNFKERLKLFINKPFLIFNYIGLISYEFYCCHVKIIQNICNLKNSFTNFYLLPLIISFIFTTVWAVILKKLLKI